MKKINSKTKALEWSQRISHYKSIGIFPDTQGQLTPQSKVWSARFSNSIRNFMVVLVTCKNEEDPIKNEGVKSIFKMLKDSLPHNKRWDLDEI